MNNPSTSIIWNGDNYRQVIDVCGKYKDTDNDIMFCSARYSPDLFVRYQNSLFEIVKPVPKGSLIQLYEDKGYIKISHIIFGMVAMFKCR